MQKERGNLPLALLLTLVASVILAPLPIVGHVLAAWLGSRRAGRSALVVGIVAAVLWGAGISLVSGKELSIGGTQVGLGPLSLLLPAICASLLAGSLFAYGGRWPILLGTVLVVAGAVWSGRDLQPVVGLIRQLRPAPARQTTSSASCPEHLEKLYTAAMLYADSWDGKLPPADRWEEALQETVSDRKYLHCPAAGDDGHGYAMNETLGGKSVQEVPSPSSTPLFFDSTLPGPNAHGGLHTLPVPGRHEGTNYAVYADGHSGPIAAK